MYLFKTITKFAIPIFIGKHHIGKCDARKILRDPAPNGADVYAIQKDGNTIIVSSSPRDCLGDEEIGSINGTHAIERLVWINGRLVVYTSNGEFQINQ